MVALVEQLALASLDPAHLLDVVERVGERRVHLGQPQVVRRGDRLGSLVAVHVVPVDVVDADPRALDPGHTAEHVLRADDLRHRTRVAAPGLGPCHRSYEHCVGPAY